MQAVADLASGAAASQAGSASAKRLAGIERFSLQALIAGVLSKLGKPRYNRFLFRGVAKLVKALDFDSSMRRFESFLPCQNPKPCSLQ